MERNEKITIYLDDGTLVKDVPLEYLRDFDGQRITSVIYTERLTKQEIKSMYPELYAKHFAPTN